MANYHYRCRECDGVTQKILPMSSDPSELHTCECGGDMHRIIVSKPSVHGIKVWAGDWFKKEYGHDMADGAMERVRQREEYEKELDKLKQDGVKITHKSRQVGGKGRIKIPEKKDD